MEKLPNVLEALAKAGFRVSGNPDVGVVIWDKANRGVLIPHHTQEAVCLTTQEVQKIEKRPNPLAALPSTASGAKVDAATNVYLENLGGLTKVRELFSYCPASRQAR